MDNAVALVQAYLRLNGYFTVSEYPVIAVRNGGYRSATDLDILAFRFPATGRIAPSARRDGGDDEDHAAPDPALGIPADRADMIIGEVKEGRAVLNDAATVAGVLRAVLVAFGPLAVAAPSRHHAVVSLRRVVGFLRAYVRDHREMLRGAESKDPAFVFLITLAKAEEGTP